MKHLTLADEILLVLILHLGEEAYSTPILEEMERRVGKAVTVGSLWVSLDSLAERGHVRKHAADEPPPAGGRPRVYYRLTPKGLRALRRAQDLHRQLWEGLPDLDGVQVR